MLKARAVDIEIVGSRDWIATLLRVSTIAVVLSGYLALVSCSQYSGAILLIPLFLFLFMPLGEWLDGRFKGYRKVTRWISVLCLLFAPVAPFLFDLLPSVIGLTVYIQAYSIIHRKRPRNYFDLYLMSFFLLLAACVQSPDPSIALVMILFLFSMVTAAMMLQLQTELVRSGSVVSPDILGLDGVVPPASHGIVPQHSPHSTPLDLGLLGAVVAVSFVALLITAGLFVTTPRMEAGLFGQTDATVFLTGRTQTVNLAEGGSIVPDSRAIMRVTFPDEPDGQFNGVLFWRCTALTEYRGSVWARREISPNSEDPGFALRNTSTLLTSNDTAQEVVRDPIPGRRNVRQLIYVDTVPEDGVPALTLVQRIRVMDPSRGAIVTWSRVADFSVLLAGERQQRWLQYEAWSDVEQFTATTLRNAPADYSAALNAQDYELLTHENLEPETKAIVDNLLRGKETVYDKVMAISGYLNSNRFQYTRDLPTLPAEHPIDAFVRQTRIGHCELYASAMALMLRSAGIPTRVVSGYRGGEWSGLDRSYTVRGDMAHLWVEVYFIGLGWVSFDPSPEDLLSGGLAGTRLARIVSRYALRAKMLWYRDVVGFNQGFQLRALANLGAGLVRGGIGLVSSTSGGPAARWTSSQRMLVLLVFLLALFLWVRRLNRRRRRPVHALLTDDQARAVRLFQKLKRKLYRLKVPCDGLTAEEIGERLETTGITGEAGVHDVLQTYNEVRFGTAALPKALYKGLLEKVGDLGRPGRSLTP